VPARLASSRVARVRRRDVRDVRGAGCDADAVQRFMVFIQRLGKECEVCAKEGGLGTKTQGTAWASLFPQIMGSGLYPMNLEIFLNS